MVDEAQKNKHIYKGIPTSEGNQEQISYLLAWKSHNNIEPGAVTPNDQQPTITSSLPFHVPVLRHRPITSVPPNMFSCLLLISKSCRATGELFAF